MKSASIDLVGVGVFAVCLTATPSPAHAYLDPGTGSYILQAAMAALLAAVFSIKLFFKQIRAAVSERFNHKRKETDH